MKQVLLSNWTLMRILRIVAGLILLVSAFIHRDTLVGSFGIFFLLQGVFNFNTCGMGGCYISSCATYHPDKKLQTSEELTAEIVE
jgi:hypothetical protein